MLTKVSSDPKAFWKALKPKSKINQLIYNNITSSQWEHYTLESCSKNLMMILIQQLIMTLSFSVSNHSYNAVDEGSPHTPPPVESISDISLQEIELSILKLKSGKSPRNDHITT